MGGEIRIEKRKKERKKKKKERKKERKEGRKEEIKEEIKEETKKENNSSKDKFPFVGSLVDSDGSLASDALRVTCHWLWHAVSWLCR